VTVSTALCGRGTDIIEEEASLVVIVGAVFHSMRVDRQLRGRSGRQGKFGESYTVVSLEDEFFDNMEKSFYQDFLKRRNYASVNNWQNVLCGRDSQARMSDYVLDTIIDSVSDAYRNTFFHSELMRTLAFWKRSIRVESSSEELVIPTFMSKLDKLLGAYRNAYRETSAV
jgi:hypothetical protein